MALSASAEAKTFTLPDDGQRERLARLQKLSDQPRRDFDALIQRANVDRFGSEASVAPGDGRSDQTQPRPTLSGPLRTIVEGLCLLGLGELAKRLVTSAIDPSGGAIGALAPKAIVLLLAIAGISSGRKQKDSLLPPPPFEADLEQLLAIPELNAALDLRSGFAELLMKEAPGKRSLRDRLRGIFGGKQKSGVKEELLAASTPWLGAVDNVETIEINTFGEGKGRTAILYRDADGSIVDWRWYTSPDQIPQPLGDGREIAVWDDQGKPRTVYCKSLRFTRTLEDREVAERKRLPEHKRRKLSR